jgi:uncharacterized protein YraI
VWGTLYPDGRMSSTPEIVVSSVTSSTPAPTPTPVNTQPQATVSVAALNMRLGPGTNYPVIGSLTLGETCDIIGRNAATSWWNVQCPKNLKGWVAAQLVSVTGSTANVPIIVAPPPPTSTPVPPSATCSGWTSAFYPNRDLLGSPATSACVNQINFNWNGASPYPQMPATNWSARFERTVNVTPGNYQLHTVSDDGVRVWQDGNLVIDNWAEQSPTERSTTVYLTGAHQFRVDYFQGGGGQQDGGIDIGWGQCRGALGVIKNLGGVAEGLMHLRQCQPGSGLPREQPRGLFQRGDGFARLPGLQVSLPQLEMMRPHAGFQLNGLGEMFQRGCGIGLCTAGLHTSDPDMPAGFVCPICEGVFQGHLRRIEVSGSFGNAGLQGVEERPGGVFLLDAGF